MTASKLQNIKIGFIPLVDCALLAVAKEKGFAEKCGIDLELYKEVSWANIRDKVFLGYLDGAHMLAPMAVAANLSLMPNSCDIIAPLVLGRNGNAITVSNNLFAQMSEFGDDLLDKWDLHSTGNALKEVIEQRKKDGLPRLRFGMVFPFSCHNYHLRYWMSACGIDPDLDVHLEVVPPPFMDQYLEEGRIDGFCVGDPWNSLAVEMGIGVIVATTSQIWSRSPEKLLGLKKDWVVKNPALLKSFLHALEMAANWAGDPAHFNELAKILSSHEYLDVPSEIVMRSLTGHLMLQKGAVFKEVDDFLSLSSDICPHLNAANWLLQQMKRCGQAGEELFNEEALMDAFSAQTYADALGVDVPENCVVDLFDVA